MKHKKLIALLAASVMTMSSMTVLADTIEGDVNYVDKTIYKVTLPTTTGMSFTLDPQGLSSLDDDGVYSDTEAGKIVSTTSMVAKNESSVAVNLNADFYLVDSSDSNGALFVEALSADSTVKEVAMVITANDGQNETEIKVTGTDGDGEDFTMSEATYNFELDDQGEYAYVMEAGSGSELTMIIGGTVAKDADWSAYIGDGEDVETITLHAVFKFTDTKGTSDDTTDDYELTGDDIVAATPAGPVASTYSKTSGAEITLDTEKLVVSAISAGLAEDECTTSIASSKYTFDKDTKKLTLSSGLFTVADAGSTRYLKITYGDSSTVVIPITIAE